MPRYLTLPSLRIRLTRDIRWYARCFIHTILPELIAGFSTMLIFILLPIVAAFFA